MLRVVSDGGARAEMRVGLDEIVREGARQMLAAALEAEVDDYVTGLADERDGCGHRLTTRNGHGEPRTVTTAVGGIEIQAPRVTDRRVHEATGEHRRFRSVIAAVVPQGPEGIRGVAVDVATRDELGRLRSGPGRVLRLRRGALGVGDHPVDHAVAGRAAGLRRTPIG